jgi:predicted TIM-barrel fold metal-dependent hydrolase
MLDALERHPDRLRGVAVAEQNVPAAELRRFASRGVRALRFNHFFRGGQLHYRGGVALSAAQALAPLMKDLGRHLQLNLFNAWMPDEGARQKILADNPARLYGFPGS